MGDLCVNLRMVVVVVGASLCMPLSLHLTCVCVCVYASESYAEPVSSCEESLLEREPNRINSGGIPSHPLTETHQLQLTLALPLIPIRPSFRQLAALPPTPSPPSVRRLHKGSLGELSKRMQNAQNVCVLPAVFH